MNTKSIWNNIRNVQILTTQFKIYNWICLPSVILFFSLEVAIINMDGSLSFSYMFLCFYNISCIHKQRTILFFKN